jgi:hypothetical protein
MNRITPATIAIIILLITVFLNFWWAASNAREIRELTATVARLTDSLAMVHRDIDSLKAQSPGLGDYMSVIQLHAAKLWFAARAGNWDLAKYERGELDETMAAAGTLHERKKGVDITAVLQSVRQTQVQGLDRAIDDRNLREFEAAYNETLSACNGCHRPAGYEFIHIIPPTREPVTNQEWKVSTR